MVGTRWESSNRPLFVRTVWRDGHHHVVLEKEDEVRTQTARSTRRNFVSDRKLSTPSPDKSNNVKVPSVKLLLAGLRSFKTDTKLRRCKTETRDYVKSAIKIDIIPSDSIRYNNLNKQVSFQNERRPLKLAAKSHSVEVNNFHCECESNMATPPPFSYDDYCPDPYTTNLSERVMIWLDLAAQNHRQFKNVDLKKRILTAQACPVSQRSTKNDKHVERRKSEKQERTEDTATPVVTSQIEFNQFEELIKNTVIEEKKPVRTSTAKRQLHIFLPNLPKKTSDSGSFLSSSSKKNNS